MTAYREAGVPAARILIINPQGEIHTSTHNVEHCWATYPMLLQLKYELFPPLNQVTARLTRVTACACV